MSEKPEIAYEAPPAQKSTYEAASRWIREMIGRHERLLEDAQKRIAVLEAKVQALEGGEGGEQPHKGTTAIWITIITAVASIITAWLATRG